MVSFCASCPCYILSWWRRPRASCGGQWLAFNIYGASRCSSRSGVLSSRLAFLLFSRLVAASRFSSRPWASRLAVLCWRLVSFRSCVLSRRVSRWGVLCRWRFVPFSSPCSSFRSSARFSFRPVLSCRFRGVVGSGGVWRRRWCSLAVIWCWGRGCLVSRILIGSVGR